VPADDAAEESDSEPGESSRVSGLISRPEHGCGRSSTDKLFLYLNGRPWDNTRLTRAFAEVYRTFTGQQPMVVADFHIDGNRYDVNVSPDKRTMLVHDEAAIVEQLKVGRAIAPGGQDSSADCPPGPARGSLLAVARHVCHCGRPRGSQQSSSPVKAGIRGHDQVVRGPRASARRHFGGSCVGC